MALDNHILNEIVELLTPFFRNESDRLPFLVQAFGNSRPIIDRTDFTGPGQTFTNRLVTYLDDYGEIEPGKPALCQLVEHVYKQVGPDNKERVKRILKKLNCPNVRSQPFLPDMIPTFPTKLIGRDDLRETIHADLDAGYNVSLNGMPGIGKTAIAAVVARERSARGETVLWLNVKQDDWASMYDEIWRIAGYPQEQDIEEKAKYHRARALLNSMSLNLIVLDNAWNPNKANTFRQKVLPEGCRLMLTSHKNLGIGRVYIIDPLDDDKSADLFRSYAGFSDTINVSSICQLLDGHPMALKIAGRMAKDYRLSLDELYSRLTSAKQLVLALELDTESESVWRSLLVSYETLTHQTLQAIVKAFGALWFPAATFELLGLIAELGPRWEEKTMMELRRAFLVAPQTTPDEVTRYRIHTLTHDFASALLLKNGELEEERRRALTACVEFARCHARRDSTDHNYLEAEIDNLRSAIEFAYEHELWDVVDKLTLYLWGESEFLDQRGNPREEIIASLEMGCRAARQLKRPLHEAIHLGNLGLAYRQSGRIQEAIERYHQALGIIRSYPVFSPEEKLLSDRYHCILLERLSFAHYLQPGQEDIAIEFAWHGIQIARTICFKSKEGKLLGNLGDAHRRKGDFETAINHFEEALEIAKKIGDQHGESDYQGGLGTVYIEMRRPQSAVGHLEEALKIARKIGDRRAEGAHLGNLGLAHLAMGHLNQALDYIEPALDIAQKIGDKRREGKHLGILSQIYIRLNELDKAEKLVRQSFRIEEEIGDWRGVAFRWHDFGCIAMARAEKAAEYGEKHEQYTKAVECFERALKIRREIRDHRADGETAPALEAARARLAELTGE
ncbi:MAG: tetratricopeptide repeat protein [Anaerolineae bacterium]|nr:tetratricopeptide repeat protein [Anaerolineae bacterium]